MITPDMHIGSQQKSVAATLEPDQSVGGWSAGYRPRNVCFCLALATSKATAHIATSEATSPVAANPIVVAAHAPAIRHRRVIVGRGGPQNKAAHQSHVGGVHHAALTQDPFCPFDLFRIVGQFRRFRCRQLMQQPLVLSPQPMNAPASKDNYRRNSQPEHHLTAVEPHNQKSSQNC